jgi:hypothetical protein
MRILVFAFVLAILSSMQILYSDQFSDHLAMPLSILKEEARFIWLPD